MNQFSKLWSTFDLISIVDNIVSNALISVVAKKKKSIKKILQESGQFSRPCVKRGQIHDSILGDFFRDVDSILKLAQYSVPCGEY